MSVLGRLQRRVQDGVLRGDAGDVCAEVIATPAAGSARRLGVYVHGYRARLAEVLGNDFPGLRALAGDAVFERLCAGYIEATSSTHYNVHWYGGALADFLRGAAAWSAQPHLAAMAQLEWKLGLAFDAADAPFVDAAAAGAIAAEAWPGLRMSLGPSLQRDALAWNVSALRRALDHDETIPPLQEWNPPRAWIAWRHGVSVHHRCMEDDEAAALDAVQRGASFADVCECLCAWHAIDAVAVRASGLLRRWIDDRWVMELLAGSA